MGKNNLRLFIILSLTTEQTLILAHLKNIPILSPTMHIPLVLTSTAVSKIEWEKNNLT